MIDSSSSDTPVLHHAVAKGYLGGQRVGGNDLPRHCGGHLLCKAAGTCGGLPHGVSQKKHQTLRLSNAAHFVKQLRKVPWELFPAWGTGLDHVNGSAPRVKGYIPQPLREKASK